MSDCLLREQSCRDDEFSERSDFLAWTRSLANGAVATCGPNPQIRVYAYNSGGAMLAVDVFSADRRASISITIAICEDSVYLPRLNDPDAIDGLVGQVDMTLPGVLASFAFLNSLLGITQGMLEPVKAFWLNRPDTLISARLATNF